MLQAAKWIKRKLFHYIRIIQGVGVNLTIDKAPKGLVRIGSAYGGWYIIDRPDLKGATIISCGAGEDISFDVEFARRYQAKVCIVDPTPRSIAHVDGVLKRIGLAATSTSIRPGNINTESYDMSELNADQFKLIKTAIWTNIGTIKFFSPPNKAHVSHSIINFQNNYSSETDFIEVPCAPLSEIMGGENIQDLPLLKLDIEGAEIEVLSNMVAEKIFPRQICVEYDEILKPSRKGKQRIEGADALLRSVGYRLVHMELANCLYIRG